MAIAYGAISQSGLLSQQYPPPLLPKPGKDNVRLQKLLKRTAKKKASAQSLQSAAPFRSSLSPVNEASPDLEHSDHSTPPKTPEAPFSFYNVQQPQRFTVRPLYQHVASPYPQRAAYGRAGRFSPQTVSTPTYSYSQNVTSYSASAHVSGVVPTPEPVAQLPVPKITQPAFPMPEATAPAFGRLGETSVGLKPVSAVGTPHPKSPGPTPYHGTGAQSLIRPLTVLTQLKSKSPRPTFKATEPSRSPKPMFDVPQIRMYTASTSYYETSRTPPVYDTAGLTNIGSTVTQSRASGEPKPDLGQVSETKRGTTPTPQPPLSGSDNHRKTPPLETKSGPTPAIELTRARTPTSELKRVTPTAEIKRSTPTADIKRATPTSEIRVKTPTYEFQSRISAGRPRTPSYHTARAATPVFEVSRPNPLLFAVSPITVEPDRSRSSSSASLYVATPEPKPTETVLNGDILLEVKSAGKPIQQSITKSKSESDLTGEKSLTAPAGTQRLSQTPSPQTTTQAGTSYGYQRPRTPTFEASRLMTTSPGYKRPKTPTYGMSSSAPSPVAFQRPKTPTQVAQKSKSSYRGLTPAEYAAFGGIKTYTPAFGITSSKASADEECAAKEDGLAGTKTLSQELPVKTQSMPDVSKVIETPKVTEKPSVRDEKVATTLSVPIIIVSQASDSAGTPDTSVVSSQILLRQEKTVTQEAPKAPLPAVEVKTPEIKKVEPPVEPSHKTPEAKPSQPKAADQDPLKAVRKLLGKDRVQAAETKLESQTKAGISKKKEATKPVAAINATTEVSKPTDAAVAEKPSAAKPEKKEGDESFPAAEPLLKVLQKPKGVKSKVSGWSRLKKHMVVEQEEPKFPDIESQTEEAGKDQSDVKKVDAKATDKPGAQDEIQSAEAPKVTKMWDAVLFQMFSSKENIMHQIELNKSEEEKNKEETKGEKKEIPSFAHRLPVLLFSPRFDAKRLKEAASRPVTKISTVFEMGLIGRKGKEEEPKDFNRTARGFAAT